MLGGAHHPHGPPHAGGDVKVTGGGGSNTSHGVNAHFIHIGRRGDFEIETDDGERLSGRGVGGI